MIFRLISLLVHTELLDGREHDFLLRHCYKAAISGYFVRGLDRIVVFLSVASNPSDGSFFRRLLRKLLLLLLGGVDCLKLP